MSFELRPIGVVRTPYGDWAPYQPPARQVEPGAFRLELDEEHAEGLDELERFSHIFVLTFLDRADRSPAGRVAPPWAKGKVVGLFASRSPDRPNPVGLSVVEVLKIEGSTVFVSPLDVYDQTPLIDIKPYIPTLDARQDANEGWIEDFEDKSHLLQHLRGEPHQHDHGHGD